jgi:hypothetical protein
MYAGTTAHEVVDLLGARLGLEDLAPRQADLAVAVDLHALDDDLVALLQHVLDGADALVRDLADVQQAVGARQDLDERADLDDALDHARVVLADLGLHRQAADQRLGLLEAAALADAIDTTPRR